MADQLNNTYSERHNGCWSLEDCHQSPILINLAEDAAYDLTDLAGGVSFDIDGGGQDREQVSWTAPGTEQAFLWLDRNGNNAVDGGQELFGDLFTPNGFEELRLYDLPSNGGNNDGVLDAQDAIWPSLKLWIDYNHDGVSQPWEIFSLAEKGIKALDLHYKLSGRRDSHSNLFRYWAIVTFERDGRLIHRRYYDVFLVKH